MMKNHKIISKSVVNLPKRNVRSKSIYNNMINNIQNRTEENNNKNLEKKEDENVSSYPKLIYKT